MLRVLWPLLWGTLVGALVVMAVAWNIGSSPRPWMGLGPSTADSPSPPPASDFAAGAMDSIDALAEGAWRSPATALNQLGSLDRFSRASAIETAARVFAEDDPIAALERIRDLRGELQFELRDAVLEQWALIDPAAVVAYLASIDSTRDLAALFGNSPPQWARTLAAVVPDLVFESSRELPDRFGTELRMLAIRAMAEVDPLRAAAVAKDTADRAERDRYATAVGGILGVHDPDAALEWLQGMESPHWNTTANVLGGIAENDIARAAEVVLTTDLLTDGQMSMISLTSSGTELSGSKASGIVDRVAEVTDNPLAPELMRQLISAWAESDLDAALAWILANDRDLPGTELAVTVLPGGIQLPRAANQGWNLLTDLAHDLGQRDIETAMSYVVRLPEDRRGEWIEEVIGAAALRDAAQALVILEPYRGQPFFDSAYQALVLNTVSGSPRQAADMLTGAPPQTRDRLIRYVARRWAETDPDTGARDWVMTLPPGSERDAGLDSLLLGLARSGEFDAGLLSSFSRAETMQRSLMSVISELAQTRGDLARRIIDEHIEDEALRAQATGVVERAETDPR